MVDLDDALFILMFVIFSILIGLVGFKLFVKKNWFDSLCAAQMALTGHYPMELGEQGLLFISMYTLYGSVIFFVVAGIVIASLYTSMRGKPEKKSPPQGV